MRQINLHRKAISITIYIILMACLLHTHTMQAQCVGGANGGNMNPTNAWATIAVAGGSYYTFTHPPDVCQSYSFTFCSNGGTAGFDTEITILDNSGNYVGAFNEDACSLKSEILNFTPPLPGVYRVLINKYSCKSGGTGTLAYRATPSGNSNTDYSTQQNATPDNTLGTNCVQLTAATNGQKGCAWGRVKIDLAQPFDYSINVYLGNNDGGADGCAFLFHRDPRGLCACGTEGMYIGTGGIKPSFVVELDTFDNGTGCCPGEGQGNDGQDHIAISKDGVVFPPDIAAAKDVPNMEDGKMHLFRITWNPGTKNFVVYFDGTKYQDITYDLVNNIFGGQTQVYWGFTSSTGGYNNQQYFCPINLPVPIKLISFQATCKDHNRGANLHWVTASEYNNNYFEVQRSSDNANYQSIAQVAGHGTSATTQQYDFEDNSAAIGTYYYRLKQVDYDGQYDFTPVVVASCEAGGLLLKSVSSMPSGLHVVYHTENVEQTRLKLLNILGQAIAQVDIQLEPGWNEIDIPMSNMESGVFLVLVETANQQIFKKIIVHK